MKIQPDPEVPTAMSPPQQPDANLVVAGPEHLEALERALRRRRFWLCPMRPWTEEQIRSFWLELLHVRFQPILEDPKAEILLETQAGEVRSFLVVLHELREGASGRPESRVYPPSWVDSPRVLQFAAGRARARGSELLAADVAAGDEHQRSIHEEFGMEAESQRIIVRVEEFDLEGPAGEAGPPSRERIRRLALARSARMIKVRRAEFSDRLFLMQLATECVSMMFHERRRGDIDRTQERFFDSYALLELGPDTPLDVWVASTREGELAGAMLVNPKADDGLDGLGQSYIHDISVLPEYWGRGVGAALTLRSIEELRRKGITYLTGDISTDNDRIRALADRFGFIPEGLRYVIILD